MYQTEHIDELFKRQNYSKNGVPMFWEIELSPVDACNRSCAICPRSDPKIAPNTPIAMDKRLVSAISEELYSLNFMGLVMIGGYCEPLLHPSILDIVYELRFCNINLITNSDLLDKNLAKQLIENGCNKILISCYDVESLRKAYEIQAYLTKDIIVRDRTLPFDGLNNRAGTLGMEHSDRPCYYPDYMMMIDANGDVFPCPQEWQRRLKIGNAYQQSLWNIWTGQRLAEIRGVLNQGKRELYPCDRCNVNGTIRGKENNVKNLERSI